MPTTKFVMHVDFGFAYRAQMEETLKAAPSVAFAHSTIDKDNHPYPPLQLQGVKDVSPTLEQWKRARNAKLQGVALESHLLESMTLNLRQEYARYLGPTPVMISHGFLDELRPLAEPISKVKMDIPTLKHILATAPSRSYQATSSLPVFYQEATALQNKGNIDLCILYTTNSPLVASKGEEYQHHVLARFLASISVAHQYKQSTEITLPRLAEQLRRIPVWALAAASTQVAAGPSHSRLYAAARWFKPSLPQRGGGNLADTTNQTSMLYQRVVHDIGTHTLDAPADEKALLLFVSLLPFQPDDPQFEEAKGYLQEELTAKFLYPIGIFLPTDGNLEAGRQKEYVSTVFCLYPVLSVGQLEAPQEPMGAIAAPES
jgi:hypothetical protein